MEREGLWWFRRGRRDWGMCSETKFPITKFCFFLAAWTDHLKICSWKLVIGSSNEAEVGGGEDS